MTAEDKPGSRIIQVTISPLGEGKIVVSGDPDGHQPAFPEQMNGAEAQHRAQKLQQLTNGYEVRVDDQTWQN